MASIQLHDISKDFGDARVLHALNLDVRDGEFLTLVGPSGCGKSTLLRIIAGLETQSTGNVLIDKQNVDAVRPSRRNLAMVFQSYALYPHLTVEENMLTPLKMRDLSFLERFAIIGPLIARRKHLQLRQLVREAAETLKIESLLQRKPGQLSGGQRQRAALGRAMVRSPVGFLMDEPLSNLDAALRGHMRAELAELHRSLGTTFVYVTHDQAEALTMSDRMAVMMDGEILQLDSPDAIYKDPQHRKVAEFIGMPAINMLPGHVDSTGRAHVLNIPIRKDGATRDAAMVVGLRPEHLSIAPPTSTSVDIELPFKLRYRENLGADFFLHGTVNGTEHRLVVRATPEEAAGVAIGAEFAVRMRPDKELLFGEDGSRLHLPVRSA